MLLVLILSITREALLCVWDNLNTCRAIYEGVDLRGTRDGDDVFAKSLHPGEAELRGSDIFLCSEHLEGFDKLEIVVQVLKTVQRRSENRQKVVPLSAIA